MSVFGLFDKYGTDNFDITLLENVNAKCRDELHVREGYYIKSINCVNKVIAGRKREQYRLDNKEIIKEQLNQYYLENKEKINEQVKQYRLNNKEATNEYLKKYYIENKHKYGDRSKKYMKEHNDKVVCECGGNYSGYHKNRHIKTIKHQTYLQTQLTISINTSINETD